MPKRRKGGRVRDYVDLQNCAIEAGLFDCKVKGQRLTWCNNRQGDQRVTQKSDRAMCNNDWLVSSPNTEAEFLVPGLSDHSPIILKLYDKENSGPKQFRFWNWWTKKMAFVSLVQDAWQENVRGNPMFRLVMKLKRVKSALCDWRNNHF